MNPDPTSQQPVIDFLADPHTHGGNPVTRIDTHAAAVFLAGDRALKIKRAVWFPFLDYTTLAKRKEACEAEIKVNRPYAPALYRGVVAIVRTADGVLAIGGNGEPIEWAVEMGRFDETQTLDHLADAGCSMRRSQTTSAARWRARTPSRLSSTMPTLSARSMRSSGKITMNCARPPIFSIARPSQRSPPQLAQRSRACVRS